MATFIEIVDAFLIPLLFLIVPFVILHLKGNSLSKSFKHLYLNKYDFFSFKGLFSTFSYSLLLLIAMLIISALESYILAYFGLLDLDKVSELLKKQPMFVLWSAVLLSPIAEEIFFRGFLQRRFGINVSVVAFGISHALYGSIAELIGAFTLGIMLSYYVSRKKSLAVPIFAHMGYNLLAIISLVYQ